MRCKEGSARGGGGGFAEQSGAHGTPLFLREGGARRRRRWEGERFHRRPEKSRVLSLSISRVAGHAPVVDKTANARRLRRSQALAEKTLWTLVRNRRLGGGGSGFCGRSR
ncbi:DUF559 domain-containing protein [Caulobacter sp. ErkDOM-YI]|uniref:DUF559 domain-containing protein n=1 Tax=unclassified Caulobacter TaxID=2648921 RepID=UPI003AF49A99